MSEKLTYMAYALILTFVLVGILMGDMYSISPDTNKTQFTNYTPYRDFAQLNNQNLSFNDTNDSKSNIQLAAEAMATKLATAQAGLISGDPATKILSAFGVISAFTIDVAVLFLAVLIDGENFFAGVAGNLSTLPTPWNYFGILVGIVISLFVVFAVFKIAAMVLKWDA